VTPQYAIRDTPVPEESVSALQIERAVSQVQAQAFEEQGARRIGAMEWVRGFDIQGIINRLSRVTERPHLSYRAYLYEDADPNAAALADGRTYLSTGMLKYLASRRSRTDELAFILAHELAHTAAQHLVKRYRLLQRQQVFLALVAAGASAATGGGAASAQQAGQLAVNAASLLANVANSGYSQEHELEADQLGIRYVMRAGFSPQAALELLEDFGRFEHPWPFLRTHPYISQRREDLRRYLSETGHAGGTTTAARPNGGTADQIGRLRAIQRLYPSGSVSWKNLQRQIEAFEQRRR
jgi:predicted Zn-dependent protease